MIEKILLLRYLYARYERYDDKYYDYLLKSKTTFSSLKKVAKYRKKSDKAYKKRNAIHDRILAVKQMGRL